MSDVSSLTELARFVGRSGLITEAIAVNDIAGRVAVQQQPGRQRVSDLLAVVLTLSARTRRMILPRVDVALDVFGPGGQRAVRIALPE
jgi:hypothetical protein